VIIVIAPANRSAALHQPRPRTSAWGEAPPWLDVPAFTAFAHEVEDALDGRELRYSQRLRLIKRAEHFGIKRFDANLIIAMVQNHFEPPRPNMPREKRSWLPALAAFSVAQSLILAGVWWLVR
jgi:hypothetical protein